MDGLRRIRELEPYETCTDPRHDPPKHIYLGPGVYEYVCPSCGHRREFTVRHPVYTYVERPIWGAGND